MKHLVYRSTYVNGRLWCEGTCRFLCRLLAVGPSCKGQSVWEGTASLPGVQPEGRRSSWRNLRSDSHLKDKPNFYSQSPPPSCSVFSRLTCISVSTAVQVHGCTVGGWNADRRGVNELRPFAWLAASETTVCFHVLAHTKRGLRQLFLRPGTAIQSLAHWERRQRQCQNLYYSLIKDLVLNNSGIFRSHPSPGAASIRLGRRWGPRILGNLGFFFSSPSFSVFMLFCIRVKQESVMQIRRAGRVRMLLSPLRTFILGRKLIRTRLDSRLRGSLTLTPRCFMYV